MDPVARGLAAKALKATNRIVTPAMFGAAPAYGAGAMADATAYVQAAVDYAAANKCLLLVDDLYSVDGLSLPSNAKLMNAGAADTCGFVAKANSVNATVKLKDPEVVGVELYNIYIYGWSVGQTNAVRGLEYDLTATVNTAALRNFRIDNLRIYDTKGDGAYISLYTRDSFFQNITIYKAGAVGLVYNASDSVLYGFDIGQSVSDGFQWGGAAGRVSKGKVWGSGRYVAANTANGYLWQAGNVIISDCEAQESAGSGHKFFKTGTVLKGITATNITADGDDVGATGTNPISIFNLQRCSIQGFAGKQQAGLAGNPGVGISVGGGTQDCDFNFVTTGLTSFDWTIAAGSEANRFNANGSISKWADAASTTLTPNTQQYRGYRIAMTSNATIVNPLRKTKGTVLELMFTQDATGGRTIAWGTDFKVSSSWVPSTTAGKINTITFVSDGTSWVQTAGFTGL